MTASNIHRSTQPTANPTGLKACRLPATLLVAVVALSGCENGLQVPSFLKSKDKPDVAATATPATRGAVRQGEKDVETPSAFEVNEKGLWDGRPSLGGVWVAHPDVKEPERVIIRNPSSGTSVVGALFRRERAAPGPRLQVSSDAAKALKLLAGQPATLRVTALRRETTPIADTDGPAGAAANAATFESSPDVSAKPLDDLADNAAAALDASETKATTAPAPTSPPATASNLSKPFLQIGIFSVEGNARNAANQMQRAGMNARVVAGQSSGKSFWRVVVGPAKTASDRASALDKIKAQGFSDAYAVSN